MDSMSFGSTGSMTAQLTETAGSESPRAVAPSPPPPTGAEALNLRPGVAPELMRKRIVAASRHIDASHRVLAFYLVEADECRHFLLWGHSSIHSFAREVLGFSRRSTRELLRAGRKLRALPAIDADFANGKLRWSAVRELMKVVVPEHEEKWLDAARKVSHRKLEELVSTHREGDAPYAPKKGIPNNKTRIILTVELVDRVKYENLRRSTAQSEEALKGYEATRGRQDPLTLLMIGNLGANYVSVGRASEGVPLLEEAWTNAKKHPKLSQVGAQLLDAYIAVADPAEPVSIEKALAVFDEVLALSRATFEKESPELAHELHLKSIRLITLKAYAPAEPLLREALAIREKHEPDKWTTFNTMSMLGEVLLGQNKPTEAEPLLLAGYNGMKARESAILKDGGTTRLIQSLERLVSYYDLQGNTSEAASFRAKLSEAQSAASRPSPR